MNEKVMYVSLPEGAKYRKAELTESGEVAISYMETCDCKHEITQATQAVSEANTPTPLIGGTNVYHKENGTNYWYCKIKDGRDEFMYLPFGDITKVDLLYENGKERVFSTLEQKAFREEVLEAIENMPTEGYRWIPVYEPSKGEDGEIQFIPGKNVLMGLASYEWIKRLKEYSPENESQEASKTTYFLLLMRWLKDGIASLEQIADNSKEIGHFSDSKDAKYGFEKTGEREFGGLCGFVGNTYKAVNIPGSRARNPIPLWFGGDCFDSGEFNSLVHMESSPFPSDSYVGLLELKK